MNSFRFLLKSLLHYRLKHLAVLTGIAVSMAVLTGALMVGDTVAWNLRKMVDLRLGRITHSVNCGDRFVTLDLAGRMEEQSELLVAPIMQLQGMLLTPDGRTLNRVSVAGVNTGFGKVTGIGTFNDSLRHDEVIVSRNVAEHLGVKVGDELLLRIRKASLVPLNAPFVADNGGSVLARVRIRAVAGDDELGRYSLRVTQSPPFNLFMSLTALNALMETSGKANTLLISAGKETGTSMLQARLKEAWQPADEQLKIVQTVTGELSITSERVFLDDALTRELQGLTGEKQFILTYFINAVEKGQASTPYSFVSTLPEESMGRNEIVINRWLAGDLGAGIGDTLLLRYFLVGPLRELREDSARFVVREVVDLKGIYADPTLMPDIPGLTDAGNCRDWETGIPIKLDRIRDKDEDYWNRYRGTPKAFIRIDRAVELWQNRFGSYTALRIEGDSGIYNPVSSELRQLLDPAGAGITVTDVRATGKQAAVQGTDFSQLFIGLGFFVLLAAVILTILLLYLNLEGRKEQVAILSATGFTRSRIISLLATEQLLLCIPAIVLGILLAVFYNHLVFKLLNGLWGDIVRTELIKTVVLPSTLLKGALITLFINAAAVILTVRRFIRPAVHEGHRRSSGNGRKWSGPFVISAVLIPAAASLLLIVWQLAGKETVMPSVFFLSGGLMLISALSGMYFLLSRGFSPAAGNISPLRIALSNSFRNRGRSLGIVSLFALGSFIVISTGANRKDLFVNASDPRSGTGGFTWFAESAVPVLHDLNEPRVKNDLGIPGSLSFVQFMKGEGDDASCLNLNRINQPAILAVSPDKLSGRFSFISGIQSLPAGDPWSVLDSVFPSGVVPGIADETVIKWGLGMKAGDTLHYTDGNGNDMAVLLAGGLAGSVFQGNVLISGNQFLRHFPDHSGTSVFLISEPAGNELQDVEQLRNVMRDYGWDMELTAARLAAFNSVTNTYLSIFLAMGALALMIGTIGLAIILLRTMLERKSEIALLGAVGYRRRDIFRLVATEFLALLFAGILAGSLAAVIATLPSLLSPNTGVSLAGIGKIILLLVINGLFWILSFTALAVVRKQNVQALRND
ncbi:MAG: FtsX-like permease family protein [Bacteroidota bacterium]